MSIKENRAPKTSPSQDNLDYISRRDLPSDKRPVKHWNLKAANEFDEFIKEQKEKREPEGVMP